jgi:hypothetical protein
MRLPGICNFNPETVVLAHIRRGVLGGTGRKPNDLTAVLACSACHDELDHRTNRFPPELMDRYLIDGWARTIDIWVKEGLIGGKAKAKVDR